MSNLVALPACSSFLTTLITPSFWYASRASLRTSASSATRSAQMSRAPERAAAVSGTSFSTLTNAPASPSGLPSSGCAQMRSASG